MRDVEVLDHADQTVCLSQVSDHVRLSSLETSVDLASHQLRISEHLKVLYLQLDCQAQVISAPPLVAFAIDVEGPELPVSFMMRLTRAFAMRAEITRASSWSRYSFSDLKVISGSCYALGLFCTSTRA
ncbi:hypothetical protein BHE74_00029209 [Ensete ventricosum]|nr:hypothetical protein BHE74_00029209 [Ensete ventricosum]